MAKKGIKPANQKDKSDKKITFICEWCGKSKNLTYNEVEKQKKFDPDLKKEGFDYYIECPFCRGGYMFSQEDIIFSELATDLFGD